MTPTDVWSIRLEALLEQLLDLAPDPTVIVDAEGRIQFANSQLQSTFGYARVLGVIVITLVTQLLVASLFS